MGVGLNVLKFFNRSILLTIGGISGRRMVELGDQKLHEIIALKDDGGRVFFKDYIEARGCHHYSIDIHGENGSHPKNLSKPISDGFWRFNFDIVTNFGTSEHVENQVICWQNIHNLGRAGSIYIHILPEFGQYALSHCKYFYDLEFFSKLAKANGYTLVLNESIPYLGHVGACYIKPSVGSEFVFDAAWVKKGGE